MSFRIPGGVWLAPTDLGFDAAAIAAAGNLNGQIVPWVAAYRFTRMVFWLRQTGPASSVSLRLNQELDFDGVTVLRSGISGIWTTVTTGAMAIAEGAIGTTVASVGTTLPNAITVLWGAPYAQFNVLNNDGANGAIVTLRIGLFG